MNQKNTIDDGGNAFPLPVVANEHGMFQTREEGMTMRDYFAAKGMQAMLSNHHMYDGINDNCAKFLATDSYLVADAMLKARK